MIVGVGIDVCEISRFDQTLQRSPGLVEKVFTPQERVTHSGADRSAQSLAARFAAKEALAKALGAPSGLSWQDAEVITDETGRPTIEVRGTVAGRAAELGIVTIHVSLSHDAGVASAVVICEA
ncbi:MAG TPA: holo-ACP synthase [Candidatus Avipropionibacterium avicola]|uniref:Holo-[acyl-carrier-protein] synthase n=1 Tax=Candidatus Avipropionibacterium avicola TaxID=2840701 RepID=A0A9D1GYF6_9ACTN|nr:holo-ACP synthase [Candidatus Avipropionibacterium avicola]